MMRTFIVGTAGFLALLSAAPEGVAQSDPQPRLKILGPRPRVAVPVEANFRVVGKAFNIDRVKRIQVRVGRKTFRAKGVKRWKVTATAPVWDGRFTIRAQALDRRGRVMAERAIFANAIDIFRD